MPEYAPVDETYYNRPEARLDPVERYLREHREGQHSGRRWNIECRHCRELLGRDTHDLGPMHSLLGAPQEQWENGMRAHLEAERLTMTAEPQPLDDWWRAVSEDDLQRTLAKAREYGSYDMDLLGIVLGDFGSKNAVDMRLNDAELGTWFYLLGKLARGISALRDGQRPSDDTVRDIEIYARMIRRIRDCGAWPGPISEDGQ